MWQVTLGVEEGKDQGPQVDKIQFDKVMGYIESGKAEGATCALGVCLLVARATLSGLGGVAPRGILGGPQWSLVIRRGKLVKNPIA